ncbi:MAG: GNAT family N-acetyltransferase [Devosia sp.]
MQISPTSETQADRSEITVTLAAVSEFDSVAHLTFPSLREPILSHSSSRLAIAWDGAFACGLAIGIPGPNADYELTSIYVLPLYRRRGLGALLLAKLERTFVEDGVRTGVHFLTVNPKDQGRVHFLQHHGWGPTTVTGLNCRSTIESVFAMPWLVRARLPQDYRIVSWHALSAKARAGIEAGVDSWVPHDLNPFEYEADAHPATSVALVDARDRDRVRGWVITHQIGPELIRWTCSFVAPELQRQAMISPLWRECARRQRDLRAGSHFCFTVPLTHPRMARLVARRMRPHLDQMNYSCRMLKRFLSAGGLDMRRSG